MFCLVKFRFLDYQVLVVFYWFSVLNVFVLLIFPFENLIEILFFSGAGCDLFCWDFKLVLSD